MDRRVVVGGYVVPLGLLPPLPHRAAPFCHPVPRRRVPSRVTTVTSGHQNRSRRGAPHTRAPQGPARHSADRGACGGRGARARARNASDFAPSAI